MKTLIFILSVLLIASLSSSANAQTNLPANLEKGQISPTDSRDSINPQNQPSPESLDNKAGDGKNIQNEYRYRDGKTEEQRQEEQRQRKEYLKERKRKQYA